MRKDRGREMLKTKEEETRKADTSVYLELVKG